MRAAVGSVVCVAALALGAPGVAHGEQEPDGPKYRQVRPCVDAHGSPAPVENGVSWAQRRLMFTQLWTLSRGAGVKVAVIDTGVNPGEAFDGRLVAGGDLVAPQESTFGLADCDGHGTLVAALIAASAEGSGFSGVAPDAQIISIRQNSGAYAPTDPKDRRDSAGTAESLAEGIDLAVSQGAQVINISAAQCGPASAVASPRLEAAVEAAVRGDVVVVAAAGNVDSSPGCAAQNQPGQLIRTRALPAGIADALTVGAMDPDGAVSQFSLAGPWVDLAAPGRGLISVSPHPEHPGPVDRIVTENGVSEIQGTSFAAPYVTGVVALVRFRYPHLSAAQVVHRLIATANPPPGDRGFTIAAGHGEINPRRALTAVLPSESGGTAVPAVVSQPLRVPAPPSVQERSPGSAVAPIALLAVLAVLGLTRTALQRARAIERATPQAQR